MFTFIKKFLLLWSAVLLLAMPDAIAEIPRDSTAIIDAGDPLKPYLFTLPGNVKMMTSSASGSGAAAIKTEKFTFTSKNGVNTVYAITAAPQRAGIYPAIFVLHGGGGNAEGLLGLVEKYARAGYVAMTLDLPGICGTQNTPHTTGPWKSRPAGEEPRFEVAEDPANSTLTDGLVAAIQGFNLLRSRPDVDREKIGVTGFSWGGYTTTMIAGLMRNRVKAAYSVYGSGFYEKDSFWKERIAKLPAATRNTWLKYFDAGRRAPFITAPYFVEAASDDTYFRPEAVMATLNAIPGVKNQVWGPNLNHHRTPGGEEMQLRFFEYYLKGTGTPFFKIAALKAETLKDQSKKVSVNIDIPDPGELKSVQLYYSEPDPDWSKRLWVPIAAVLNQDGTYSAVIPADEARKNVSYYIYASDARGVKVSSFIQY